MPRSGRRSWRRQRRYKRYSRPSRGGAVVGNELIEFGRWHRYLESHDIALPNHYDSAAQTEHFWTCISMDYIQPGTLNLEHRHAHVGLMRIKYHVALNPVYPAHLISKQSGITAAYHAAALSMYTAREPFYLDWMIFAIYDTDLRTIAHPEDDGTVTVPDDSKHVLLVSADEGEPDVGATSLPATGEYMWLKASEWDGPRPDSKSFTSTPFYTQKRILNDKTVAKGGNIVKPHVLRRGTIKVEASQVNSSVLMYETTDGREITFQSFRHPVVEIDGTIPLHKVEYDMTTQSGEARPPLSESYFPMNVRYFFALNPKYMPGRTDPWEFAIADNPNPPDPPTWSWTAAGASNLTIPQDFDNYTTGSMHVAVDYWEGADHSG